MSVTVITPSFNKPQYVLDAIQSVIAQTYKDWTYYIIDNSTDGKTRKIIKEYLGKTPDERIKHLETDFSADFRNEIYVPSAICNAMYILADKKYILYLSDDDVLHKDCLGSMARYLDENPDIGACYCRGEIVELKGKHVIRDTGDESELHFGETFDMSNKPDCKIDGGQVLCRKSTIEQMIIGQELLNLFLMPRIKGAVDHSDGIFLNKLVHYTKILPCPYSSEKALLTHRCTEISTHKRKL
jgi:spore maturation protein CgeD